MPDHIIYTPSRGTRLTSLPQVIRPSDTDRYILWLDDLEQFLGDEGINPSLLDALERIHVAIVATMQDELFETYSNPRNSKSDDIQEVSRQIGNRLLRAVEPIPIIRLWSDKEVDRASKIHDERLADAITHSSIYGISEYLAAGPALIQSWRRAQRVNGNPRGAALVQASVDLARTGFSGGIDIEVLKELHTSYLPHLTLRPESWTDAKDWATRVQYGVSGLLIPGEYEDTWRAFDYLPDAISREKGSRYIIPDFIWDEALNLCPDDDDRWLIGMRAYMAGETHYAIAAWEPLAENGNGSAASNLAAIYLEMGDRETAKYWRYIESQDEFHSTMIPFDSSSPLYDPETGTVSLGEYRDGERVQVPLHRPGIGVRHGVIAGDKGVGKSNTLTLVLLGALTSGKYILWLMDWAPEQKHFKSLKKAGAVDWFSGNNLERSLNILRAAVRILEVRTEKGSYSDPTSEKPAILVAIEEAHHLFSRSDEAASLCLRIAQEGESAGVSVFLTIPEMSLECFGGRTDLRDEITSESNTSFFMGSNSLLMMREIKNARDGDSEDDPFN
ncbi:hypothetical protein [Streptomyces acidicola]|uniref:Uncharacterized protein n=1 Tax=Streptomyces acidicola TaxID=2596892 RepID=A0A5N8X516_9ACTN|nr:hypothetical protein [Streptomyces acidicola]MPY53625.1 hypothetical protein [Streptomyces acidicola]